MEDDVAKCKLEDASARYARLIEGAAGRLIAVADDSARSLVDVIADMERYIVEKTKVGDSKLGSVPVGRRGYTLHKGRLVEVKHRRPRPKAAR